jgi:hypothetical protein
MMIYLDSKWCLLKLNLPTRLNEIMLRAQKFKISVIRELAQNPFINGFFSDSGSIYGSADPIGGDTTCGFFVQEPGGSGNYTAGYRIESAFRDSSGGSNLLLRRSDLIGGGFYSWKDSVPTEYFASDALTSFETSLKKETGSFPRIKATVCSGELFGSTIIRTDLGEVPWVYRDGKCHKLPCRSANGSIPLAILSEDLIIGQARPEQGRLSHSLSASLEEYHLCLWKKDKEGIFQQRIYDTIEGKFTICRRIEITNDKEISVIFQDTNGNGIAKIRIEDLNSDSNDIFQSLCYFKHSLNFIAGRHPTRGVIFNTDSNIWSIDFESGFVQKLNEIKGLSEQELASMYCNDVHSNGTLLFLNNGGYENFWLISEN